ncbi:MAG: hypothetical protein ACR2OM_03445, partial [Aestuariivirgaceae bacterium]
IMLETVSTHSNKGRLCPARIDHLQDMLEGTGGRPVTIFMHHPPFDVLAAPDPFQFEDPGNVDALAQTLSGHPNVRQIYCGHSHRAATGEIAGIAALTIPSIAQDLRKGPPVSLQTIAPNYRIK